MEFSGGDMGISNTRQSKYLPLARLTELIRCE